MAKCILPSIVSPSVYRSSKYKFWKSVVLAALILIVALCIISALTLLTSPESSAMSVVRSIPYHGESCTGLAWDGAYLWATDANAGKIHKIDPSDGSLLVSFHYPDSCVWGLTWDGSHLWVGDRIYKNTTIKKIDRSDGSVVASFISPCEFPSDFAWDGDYLRLCGFEQVEGDVFDASIYKLTSSDGSIISSFAVPEVPSGLTWDGSYLWYSTDAYVGDQGAYKIYKLDPMDGSIVESFSPTLGGWGGGALTWDGIYLIAEGYISGSKVILFLSMENDPPTASFTYSPENPVVGEEIIFDASSSIDPDGQTVSYEWDWDNDGNYDESTTSPTLTHSWNDEGTYQVGLRVTDNDGATNTTSQEVTIAPLSLSLLEKYAPVLYFHPDEGLYAWGIFSMLDMAELRGATGIIKDMPVALEQLSLSNTSQSYLDLRDYAIYGPLIPTKEVWENVEEYDKNYFVYGRYYESAGHDKIVLQYWFFYPFNDWKFNHEGDWEMMQVILDNTINAKNPIKLCYGFHHDGRQHPWDSIKNQNIEETHPRVYVAKGGHGCWATTDTNGEHRPSSSAWLADETLETGRASYPKGVNPSSIPGPRQGKFQYTLVDISNQPSWVEWKGKWGAKVPGAEGPDSPVNIDYTRWGEQFLRWKQPVEWGDSLKEGEVEGSSHSQYIVYAQSTLVDTVSLHAYDESKLHVGETETGEIQLDIPGAYFYVPSYYSDDQKEWMWIDSSGNLRFEIKARSNTPQSSHAKGSTKKRSNLAFNAYQSESEGTFDFAFNRYLEEENLNVTATYLDVHFTQDTIAAVDVSPENPVYLMEIDLDGDGIVDEIREPDVIEGVSTLDSVIVYPNPVYLSKSHVVKITPLPSGSKVYIYTLSGELVKTLEEDSGIATWDCRNEAGQIVTRGIYIYLITSNTGKKTGKIAIIK